MLDPQGTSHLIGDRYLTSPAALRERPSGPVDALDPRSGRAAQVRVLLVTGDWDEDGLSQAVTRWCAIGTGEVCGVLDFGRSGERWYLALPPSLGVPVDRWRAMRRPTPGDAARLTLGFGHLVERVAAAGFDPDLCRLGDFAVGPGAVPFLDRPLLDGPATAPPPPGCGQRILAALLRALCIDDACPAELAEWRDRSAAAGFESLARCLDELELVGSRVQQEERISDDHPLGLDGIFDEPLDAVRPRRGRPRPPRFLTALLALAGLAAAAAAAGHFLHRPAAPAAATPPTVVRPVAPPVTAVHPAKAKPAPHAPSPQPHARRPHRRRAVSHRRATGPSSAASTSGSAPAPARSAPPAPVVPALPAPAGTATLP